MVPPFDPTRAHRQRAGFHCVRTDDEAIVLHADGIAIFRMGPGRMTVWLLLEEPLMSTEFASVLGRILPGIDGEILAGDAMSGLRDLCDAELIEAACT
jgi:hypothetical protein